jgi:hypothetical protein
MFKIILTLLATASTLMTAFQNCSNYPYTMTQGGAPLSLETRQYYLLKQGFSCQDRNNQVIQTYKDSLYFVGGDVCFTGSGCSKAVVCGPWPRELEISTDLLSVMYKGEVYQFMKTPPF